MKLIIPLVGMHFRPPAQEVLNGLALGTQVFMMPEPNNQYDRNAVRVLVDLADLSSERLDLIDALGVDSGGLISQGPFMLGYLAATGGKPARGGPGNVEALKFMQHIGNKEVFFGKLGAAPEGYPVVILDDTPTSPFDDE